LSARLIVNADDLGYDPAIDRGILEAHARGLVSAATAMVDTPFAERALAAAPATLDLGLHVVLGAGTGPARAREEVARQLERFRLLRGASPTHLDSHRHAHLAPEVLPAFAEAALGEGIPLRATAPAVRDWLRARGVCVVDAFAGDAARRPCWTLARLVAALESPSPGVVELMCHPGYAPTHARTSFGPEREVELASLCDPLSRRALERGGALLTTFTAVFSRPSGGGSAKG